MQSSIDELSVAKTPSPEEDNQQGGVCNAENNIKASFETSSTSDIMVEEISVTAEAREVDIVIPENKVIKAPKAGAKASKETIEMWRENGFSR